MDSPKIFSLFIQVATRGGDGRSTTCELSNAGTICAEQSQESIYQFH